MKAATEEEKAAAEEEEEKRRPIFRNGNALKERLRKQQEDNSELNKNLPEQIEKLKETIKIHEAKPPRKIRTEDDEEDKLQPNTHHKGP